VSNSVPLALKKTESTPIPGSVTKEPSVAPDATHQRVTVPLLPSGIASSSPFGLKAALPKVWKLGPTNVLIARFAARLQTISVEAQVRPSG
jgi:hypothetical protein